MGLALVTPAHQYDGPLPPERAVGQAQGRAEEGHAKRQNKQRLVDAAISVASERPAGSGEGSLPRSGPKLIFEIKLNRAAYGSIGRHMAPAAFSTNLL